MDYVEADGKSPFAIWMHSLDGGAQATIDRRLLQMEKLERWSEKWASKYKGRPGIIELRITFMNKQYRPLVMYSEVQRRVVILLGGAIEKGKLPRSILEAVERRRREVLKDSSRVKPHAF